MTVIIRVLWLLLTSRFRRKVGITERRTTALRVWPHEAGLTSMHNHVYLQMMEVGRWDLFLRAGGLGTALRNGWLPVIAAQSIRYRRPVRRFTRFEVQSQIVHWDDKDLYVEHALERSGETLARAVVRFRFPAGKETKSPVEIGRRLWGAESPPAPAWLAPWKASEELYAPHRPAGPADGGPG